MAEPSISKAEKRIKLLSEKVGCSEEGTLWIKETLDPFSDTPRRPVGFPDLITGNSVIQVVKQSKTFSIGATPQDVHIVMDTVDTQADLWINTLYAPGASYGNSIIGDAIGGNINFNPRGGVMIKSGAVGGLTECKDRIFLPPNYLTNGATRVLGKAFEVHNTTNKLNVGGAVTVYRDTTPIPMYDKRATTCFAAGSDTVSITYPTHRLSTIPESLAEVTRIPGSQQWEAEDGCYVVGTMASQTNNPVEEAYGIYTDRTSLNTGTNIYASVLANNTAGKPPTVSALSANALFSPFFLCGAYFTGLPAGSELTINTIWIIERFVSAGNLDLVVLAQPSPYYDPVALEIYSKTAMRLPHGVKVGENADGDWIKTIADVLATFGVPGMPIVKGVVDIWNAFPSNKREHYREHGEVVGSPSKSTVQHAKNVQAPRRPVQTVSAVSNVRVKPQTLSKPKPTPKPKPKPKLQINTQRKQR
jgi:hypothetical protein